MIFIKLLQPEAATAGALFLKKLLLKILPNSQENTCAPVSILIKLHVEVYIFINPLSANSTKRSNTLKQFVGNLPTNYLKVFDHFVGLALKGLKKMLLHMYFPLNSETFLCTGFIQESSGRLLLNITITIFKGQAGDLFVFFLKYNFV